jgi:glycosyltransferase involved in cell wall biosynthesis
LNIWSPVPAGSGVEVLHHSLAVGMPGYRLRRYSPWWSLLPPALPAFSRGGADLIHASADYGVFFKRPGVPLVATVHNYTSDRFMRDFSSRLQYLHYRSDLRLFSRMTVNTASVVVAISQFMADLIRADLPVRRPVRLIYNGIDEQCFTPIEGRRPGRRFRVLFCGNLNRRKRAGLLAPLAQELGSGFEIHYTAGLSGSPDQVAAVGDDVAQMRPLGRISYDDMPEVYRQVDALLMPSVREGFGLCVAEAMACGLPVVACAESALPELVVDRQGGYLCPVDDVRCYADAVRSLAEDSAAVTRMGEFNRERVERLFTRDRMLTEYQALFEAVLDGEFSG